MHRVQYNRARLRLVIEPQGPILIRSGKTGMDPTRPDMEWVRTRHGFGMETVYLPGSSLKGVVRSQAERIIATLDSKRCNDPFGRLEVSKEDPPPTIYRRSCAIARTFGSLNICGRTQFSDAYPWPLDATPEQAREKAAQLTTLNARTGVAIDRKTGGAQKRALYNLEVVEQGQFETELGLSNFQLWQLALLMFTLNDIDEGFVRIGSGKSRGMGRVRCHINEVVYDQIRLNDQKDNTCLVGVGQLSTPEMASTWDLIAPATDEAKLNDSHKLKREGFWHRLRFRQTDAPLLRQSLLPPWEAFLGADWQPEAAQ